MPQHRDIADMRPGDQFDEFFLCRDASLKTTRKGSLYVEVELIDRSGSIKGRMLDAAQEDLAQFPRGEVLKVRAAAEEYQGRMQIKIAKARPAHESEYDLSELLPTSAEDPEALEREFRGVIESIQEVHLQALLGAVFDDEEFWKRFQRSPAAERMHHPFIHGLLEHTVTILRAAEAFTRVNPRVDRDLLLAGVCLHDIGKAYELSPRAGFSYTDEGMLVGHIVIGAMRAEEAMRRLSDFPEELRLRVLHMILSHHGRKEFGAPVVPATPEANALHFLDNLDAKLEAADRLIDTHPDPDSPWTDYQRMFEGRLFRGMRDEPPVNENDQITSTK